MTVILNPQSPSSQLQVPLKAVDNREADYKWYYDIERSSEVSTVYRVSGAKRFDFFIQIPREDITERAWIEGKTEDLFEVEPDSVTMVLLR